MKSTLAEWFTLVQVFDSDSPKTALTNGEVDIGVVWSGEAALLYAKDKSISTSSHPRGRTSGSIALQS